MKANDIEQAFTNSIAAEKHSSKFYVQLKSYTDDEQTASLFQKMADQEIEHARKLEQQWASLTGKQLIGFPNQNMEYVETVPVWKEASDISYVEALNIARDAEEQAVLYYGAFAEQAEGEVADFFNALVKEEQMHANWIEGLISKHAVGNK